ncbi:MAG: methyltransferase domain-containing protein [Treponema sp.]|nr:methyltransferase domain-containing protein [Candidatus Treponema equifaecale]
MSEYYEELFPVTPEFKKFYQDETQHLSQPLHHLGVGCGIGIFEHHLAQEGHDVTGIDNIPELLESANRKRRTQTMSLRYFQMSTLEMGRFLGKGFYNVITILDDRLLFIHDKTLLAKFFYDCRQLLSDQGKLILSIPNFHKFTGEKIVLPARESIRSKLTSTITTSVSGEKMLFQKLETGNRKIFTVTSDAPVLLPSGDEIKKNAENAGFASVKFYSDFNKTQFSADSDRLIAVLS